jgi:hypothetical protein
MLTAAATPCRGESMEEIEIRGRDVGGDSERRCGGQRDLTRLWA